MSAIATRQHSLVHVSTTLGSFIPGAFWKTPAHPFFPNRIPSTSPYPPVQQQRLATPHPHNHSPCLPHLPCASHLSPCLPHFPYHPPSSPLCLTHPLCLPIIPGASHISPIAGLSFPASSSLQTDALASSRESSCLPRPSSRPCLPPSVRSSLVYAPSSPSTSE